MSGAAAGSLPRRVPQSLERNAEFRAKVPGFFVAGSGNERLFDSTMDAIARPENRWQAANDRLVAALLNRR